MRILKFFIIYYITGLIVISSIIIGGGVIGVVFNRCHEQEICNPVPGELCIEARPPMRCPTFLSSLSSFISGFIKIIFTLDFWVNLLFWPFKLIMAIVLHRGELIYQSKV